ncbi:hypothetical protein ACQP2U_43410 (plasmid) [Nocardia sp. CA-084685]|uniref:hypothetical protein n=1 Tax=Nocardia sp. CA-084685 TaxID=3239970 RepID=UPI003D96AEB1
MTMAYEYDEGLRLQNAMIEDPDAASAGPEPAADPDWLFIQWRTSGEGSDPAALVTAYMPISSLTSHDELFDRTAEEITSARNNRDDEICLRVVRVEYGGTAPLEPSLYETSGTVHSVLATIEEWRERAHAARATKVRDALMAAETEHAVALDFTVADVVDADGRIADADVFRAVHRLRHLDSGGSATSEPQVPEPDTGADSGVGL